MQKSSGFSIENMKKSSGFSIENMKKLTSFSIEDMQKSSGFSIEKHTEIIKLSRRRFFKVKRSRYLISLTHGFNMIECNATATPVNSNTTNGLLACSND